MVRFGNIRTDTRPSSGAGEDTRDHADANELDQRTLEDAATAYGSTSGVCTG